MSLSDFLSSALVFVNSIIGVFETFFKLFFQDMPAIFGIKLGWWFIIFGFVSFLIYRVLGASDN